MPIANQDTLRSLHDKAVRQLVSAHQRRREEPLLLAVRYRREDPIDIHLLEVLDQFPGGDDDELLITEFGPSANLRMVGKLHLALGSPAQVFAALKQGGELAKALKDGEVVFERRGSEAAKVRKALGL